MICFWVVSCTPFYFSTTITLNRSDHNSVFVAKPEDVKHVMALTGFQEVDAVREFLFKSTDFC